MKNNYFIKHKIAQKILLKFIQHSFWGVKINILQPTIKLLKLFVNCLIGKLKKFHESRAT